MDESNALSMDDLEAVTGGRISDELKDLTSRMNKAYYYLMHDAVEGTPEYERLKKDYDDLRSYLKEQYRSQRNG